jgi:hypothetical protein
MNTHKFFSRIRGHNFNNFVDTLSKSAGIVYDFFKPAVNSFADGAMRSIEGSINNKDNWGLFGTIVADKALEYFTAPKGQVNAATPPTTGSIVKYGPAIPPTDETVIIETPAKKAKIPVRRMKLVRKIPVKKTTAKTVSQLTAPKPKKKTKRRRYAAAI